MTTNLSRLDADELLHLAVAAAKQERHDSAIDYLKRAIELEPEHAKAYYLLAAEHAQIGLYERAVKEMEMALELDPLLHTARFQLGLLHLTSGHVTEATAAWKPLDILGEDNPLFLFKKGLEHLAANEFDACRECLNKGIAHNTANADLNTDMKRVLDEIPKQDEEAPQAHGHVFLSAYSTDK